MAKSITNNAADPRDDHSTPSRIAEGAVENPRKNYRGHSEQLSEEGNTGHSGLPHRSDGSPRYDSQFSSPLVDAPKTVNKGVVNPKE